MTGIRELLITYIGPGQVWVLARIDIADDLKSNQVTALVRGIEAGMKHEPPTSTGSTWCLSGRTSRVRTV